MVCIIWRPVGPDRFGQLRRLDRRQPMEHKVGEQYPLVVSRQAVLDAPTVEGRRQAAAELNTISLRVW
jgi:hypothetical protein